MVLSLVYVLVFALALWLVLAGLHRVLGDRVRSGSGPGSESVFRTTPYDSSVVALAYVTATAQVNSRAGSRS